ncbi:helix-turn-helix domain-containing protein [Microvirga pudoricolor]|uniref:helix-turn-helix domain-containing protein n=1 Tax=Microvirga pudoricolor TaxID=2778729 RepID=UPI00194DE000|nr:helix-turn-helix domain-containing protein [Microvirga pudoricolor]MBM6595978.1 helix-turn-helix domain-containing protein [Microvirga pudoricolor]
MKAQFITTDGGEELVLLPRRDYDAMLARLGDEEAEDRVTRRIVAEARERIARGDETLIATDLSGRPARMESGNFDGVLLRELRKTAKISQQQLAEEASITQGYLSDIEGERKRPGEDVMRELLAALERLKPSSA